MRQKLGESRVAQYDALRVITTLLVVISHGNYYNLITPYGGIDYSVLVDANHICWKMIHTITHFINAFTMPVFMALGGALFFRSMERGRFRSLRALAVNKAKRLLIPFLAVATLYSFPLKLVTGYFAESESVLLDFFVGQLLTQGNTHLWYLPAMFFDFLICYILETSVKIPRVIKLAILAVVSLIMWGATDTILLVAYPLRFAVWFYAGYCFEEKRALFERHTGFGWGFLGCAVTAVIYFGVRKMLDPIGLSGLLRQIGLKLMVPAAAGLAIYAFSCGVSKTKLVNNCIYDYFTRDSFGIYLYSDPLNYVILAISASWFGDFLFSNGVGIALLYVTRIVLTLGLSILLSEFLRRRKVKLIA